MDDQVSLSTRELRETANCQYWNYGLLLLIMGLTSISIISTDDDGIYLYTHVCTTLNHYCVWVHLEVVKELDRYVLLVIHFMILLILSPSLSRQQNLN